MIFRLYKVNALVPHYIDDSMFLRQAARPNIATNMLQGLRLTNALKGIFEGIINDYPGPVVKFRFSLSEGFEVFTKLGR